MQQYIIILKENSFLYDCISVIDMIFLNPEYIHV